MHLSWNTGGYIFSAMRCQVLKTVPKCSSCRALQDDSFSILMLMGFFWLTSSCANCQTPIIRIKCKNLLQKNLNRQLYWNPHWEKVRISFQPYLFSHIVPRAENSSKVFPSSRSTRWQLWILMLMDSFWLTSNLAKKPEPSTLLKPPLRKSQDIFSAISFQPCSARCWKLFQSVPLLELYEMTVFNFDVVHGFFVLHHNITEGKLQKLQNSC